MGDNAEPPSDTSEQQPKKSVTDFELGSLVGEGSYSQVRLVVEKATGTLYAAKIVSKKQIVKERKEKYMYSEKTILYQLQHPNIIQLYCTFQDKFQLFFVLELCPHGGLMEHIASVGPLSEECACFYGAEVLSALEYMHSKGIVHRDVKPEHILLGKDMYAKLIDFGFAKQLGSDRAARSSSFCGTPEYICPELLTSKCAGREADCWAFGCTLFFFLTGKHLFKGINDYHTFKQIIQTEPEFPIEFPSLAKDLISKLLVKDPTHRLTLENVKLHSFFDTIKWEQLGTLSPPLPVPLATLIE